MSVYGKINDNELELKNVISPTYYSRLAIYVATKTGWAKDSTLR